QYSLISGSVAIVCQVYAALHTSSPAVGSPSFFFSSRGRHTRWPRDWSSDVCSSDLAVALVGDLQEVGAAAAWDGSPLPQLLVIRSEERRVGKECSTRGSPHDS